MQVLFYRRDNRGEKSIVDSLVKGIQRHGDTCRIVDSLDFQKKLNWGSEEVVFLGRSLPGSKIVMEEAQKRGIAFVYYDKGYFNRGWKTDNPNIYFRFSVNDLQPLHYFQAVSRPPDRWDRLGIALGKRRLGGRNILFAGASKKFGLYYGIDAEEKANSIIKDIRKATLRPIVYRARRPEQETGLPGTSFSGDRKLKEDLEDAHALVTFSSNAAVNALLSGVPAFVLGPGIARPVSNTDLSRIEDPFFPTEEQRFQWCCDLAYCQWRVDEMEDGSFWEELKKILIKKTYLKSPEVLS